jgi:hypothetical protein
MAVGAVPQFGIQAHQVALKINLKGKSRGAVALALAAVQIGLHKVFK